MKLLILLIGLVAGAGIAILWTRSSSLFPEVVSGWLLTEWNSNPG